LRESEAYLAEAQRLSRTGSCAWNPETGETRYWSVECFRTLGFDPRNGEPLLDTFFQRIHPDDVNRIKECLEKAYREKTGFEHECRLTCRLM
jgi:hypothetical protein